MQRLFTMPNIAEFLMFLERMTGWGSAAWIPLSFLVQLVRGEKIDGNTSNNAKSEQSYDRPRLLSSKGNVIVNGRTRNSINFMTSGNESMATGYVTFKGEFAPNIYVERKTCKEIIIALDNLPVTVLRNLEDMLTSQQESLLFLEHNSIQRQPLILKFLYDMMSDVVTMQQAETERVEQQKKQRQEKEQKELEEKKKEVQDLIFSLRQKNKDVFGIKINLHREQKDLEMQQAHYRQKMEEVMKDKESMKRERKELRKEQAKAKLEREVLERQQVHASMENDMLQSDRERLEWEKHMLLKEQESLQKARKELNDAKRDLLKKKKEMEKNRIALKEVHRVLEKSKSKIEGEKNKIETAQRRTEDAWEEVQSLRASLRQSKYQLETRQQQLSGRERNTPEKEPQKEKYKKNTDCQLNERKSDCEETKEMAKRMQNEVRAEGHVEKKEKVKEKKAKEGNTKIEEVEVTSESAKPKIGIFRKSYNRMKDVVLRKDRVDKPDVAAKKNDKPRGILKTMRSAFRGRRSSKQ